MIKALVLMICLLTAVPGTLIAQTNGAVCHQPAAQCPSSYSFGTYHLPFEIKQKLVFGKIYRSEEFYAVILKSVKAAGDPDCSFVSEEERLEAQSAFPTRKAFASHFNCPEEL